MERHRQLRRCRELRVREAELTAHHVGAEFTRLQEQVDHRRPAQHGHIVLPGCHLAGGARSPQQNLEQRLDECPSGAETGVELARAAATYVAADEAEKQELRARYGVRIAERRTAMSGQVER